MVFSKDQVLSDYSGTCNPCFCARNAVRPRSDKGPSHDAELREPSVMDMTLLAGSESQVIHLHGITIPCRHSRQFENAQTSGCAYRKPGPVATQGVATIGVARPTTGDGPSQGPNPGVRFRRFRSRTLGGKPLARRRPPSRRRSKPGLLWPGDRHTPCPIGLAGPARCTRQGPLCPIITMSGLPRSDTR